MKTHTHVWTLVRARAHPLTAALVGALLYGVARADTPQAANASPAVPQATQSVLQLDINNLTANSSVPFNGVTHTGTLGISTNITSALLDILVDGVAQNIAPGLLASVSGSINLVNGAVRGGSCTVQLTSGASVSSVIVDGVGFVSSFPGSIGPFTIDGATDLGSFTGLKPGAQFGGVDVSPWSVGQPFQGSYFVFKLGPNSAGVDTTVDIDLFFMTPPPPSADLNGDGVVNGVDLSMLLIQFGASGAADLNLHGVVNGVDLATLLNNWGPVQ